MGKIKTQRPALHAKAARIPGAVNTPGEVNTLGAASIMPSAFKATPVVTSTPPTNLDNIFSKVDIDLNAMCRDLPGKEFDDTKSGITSKSLKGMNLKKSEKMKMRREFFMKKIDAIQQAKKEAKAKKKRQKTAVVGDMQGLAKTLPTIDLLFRDMDAPQASVSKQLKEGVQKKKGIKKQYTRKQKLKKNINLFREVQEVSAFKANPLSTLTEHLNNKLKQEAEETGKNSDE